MSNKIHTQFDAKTNARLDQLFTEWTLADNRAAEYEYGQIDILFFDENGRRGTMSSQHLVDAADNARRLYDTLLNDAKSALQAATVTIVDKHTQRTTAALDPADEYAMMDDLEFTLFCGSGRAW
jgi:hypothetical protein